MMKQLYLISTALFGAGLLAFWGAATAAGDHRSSGDDRASSAPTAKAEEPTPAQQPRFTLPQVAAHAQPSDCWMAIDGAVFDVSAYVPQHPPPPSAIADWCGKEASQAFHTKNRGRPHSSYASQLLERYRIGILDSTAPSR